MPRITTPPTFGERLRALRAARGLSQQRLADRAGLSGKSFIWELEVGRFQPGWRVACALADALNCGLDDLRGGRVPQGGQDGGR
jgi:transcriptional regulator with XRE-family HTH domain